MCQSQATLHFPNSPCFHCGGTLTTTREDGEALTFCETCAAVNRLVATKTFQTNQSYTRSRMTASATPTRECSRVGHGIGSSR